MATTEQKLEAAKLLLHEMTTVLLKRFNAKEAAELAFEHYDLFAQDTKDRPEIYDAGIEIAREFAKEEVNAE